MSCHILLRGSCVNRNLLPCEGGATLVCDDTDWSMHEDCVAPWELVTLRAIGVILGTVVVLAALSVSNRALSRDPDWGIGHPVA